MTSWSGHKPVTTAAMLALLSKGVHRSREIFPTRSVCYS